MRILIHLDLDSFYCQVERHRHPELDDRPIAVQQWSGLIAVGYRAKRLGVKRFGMTVAQVTEAIPDIACVHVDVVNEKVSLEPYRAASREIIGVLQEHGLCEKMSVDEVYLDVTAAAKERRRRRCAAHRSAVASVAPAESASAVVVRPAPPALSPTGEDSCDSFDDADADGDGDGGATIGRSSSSSGGKACPGCDADRALLRELHALHGALPPDEYVFTARGDGSPATCGWFSTKPRAPKAMTPAEAAELNRRESREAGAATHVEGFDGGRLAAGFVPASAAEWDLVEGALLAAEVRRDVYWRTGYAMSAGISYNKQLSKIGSGRNKPGQQTLILPCHAPGLLAGLAIRDVPLLGGKQGAEIVQVLRNLRPPAQRYGAEANERLKVRELLALGLEELTQAFGTERGTWLFRYVRGEDDRAVKAKGPPRSLLEAKSVAPLTDLDGVRRWLGNLARNLARRVLEDAARHRRWPKNMVLMVRMSPSAQVRLSAKVRGSPGAARSCGPLPPVTRRAVAEAMARAKLGDDDGHGAAPGADDDRLELEEEEAAAEGEGEGDEGEGGGEGDEGGSAAAAGGNVNRSGSGEPDYEHLALSHTMLCVKGYMRREGLVCWRAFGPIH